MKRTKKLMAALMILICVAGVLAGCGKKKVSVAGAYSCDLTAEYGEVYQAESVVQTITLAEDGTASSIVELDGKEDGEPQTGTYTYDEKAKTMKLTLSGVEMDVTVDEEGNLDLGGIIFKK